MGDRDYKEQIKIGVILNYLNMGLATVIPLLYTPVMLRILGQDEYGLYKLSSSVTSYLSLLSLGIGSAIVRNLIKARIEGGEIKEFKVFSLFLFLYRIIALLILIIGVILSYNLDFWFSSSLDFQGLGRLKVLVMIMTVQTSLSFVLGPYSSVITAHERFLFLQLVGIALTVIGPIVNLIALFMGYSSIGLAVSSLIVSLFANVIYVYYVRNKLAIKVYYHQLPWGLLREIFVFSFWVFIAQIASLLYRSTDTLMIGARAELGATAVAVYSVGITFKNMVNDFASGFGNILMPRVNKMCFDGASDMELTYYGIKIGRLQLFIVSLLVSGFIAFGRAFIPFFAGKGYDRAYGVALVTMIPFTIPVIQNVFLNVSMAKFKHQFRSIVYLIIAVLNVIGTLLIIPYWGIFGAAVVTGIACFFGHGIAMNWFYHKKLAIDIPLFWKKVFNIPIIPLQASFLMLLINKYISYSLISLVGMIILFTVLVSVLQYCLVMNNDERALIKKMIIKKK